MDGIAVLRRASAVLPQEPGVYRFRDAAGRVIYLGRATDLRSRVRSYAGDLGARRHLRRMVPQVTGVEAIACASVAEAAWLERNLLERSLPRWNRIRGGTELVGWLVVAEGPGRPGLDLFVGDDPPTSGAFGPYLGVDRLALARDALLRAWPVPLTGSRLDVAGRSLAEARGVTPHQREDYLRQVRAVLARDPTATATLHGLLGRASDRAVGALAFETAQRIQAEAAAIDWLVATQRVTGCAPGIVIRARAGGVEFGLRATADRLDSWSTGRAAEAGAAVASTTPEAWHAFAARNAELAAALAGA